MLVVGLVRRDPEALTFGVATVVAAGFTLVRRGLLGRLGLGLLTLDTLAWMAPAAFANIRSGERLVVAGVPTLLAVLALAVLLLVVNVPPAIVLAGTAIAMISGFGWAVVAASDGAPLPAGRSVSMRDVRYTPRDVTVPKDGVLIVKNHDLFWHTFTIRGEGIDVRVPTGATRVVHARLAPGTYEFICAVPGHEQAGMTGTLEVRAP
jgi:plastocyanin